jgi:3-isopropylmalate dehydrogenase
MKANIALTPGDGIGPEVVREARQVLEAVGQHFGHRFEFAEFPLGGCAIDSHGTALPDHTLAACLGADAVLLGAVGGPKWDDPAAKVRPEQGLLELRKRMKLYANLRPVKPYAALREFSPLKPEKLEGVDILVIRELTGGVYFGQPRGRDKDPVTGAVRAFDTMVYTDDEIRRVVRLAFKLAKGRRGQVTSIDKANVLESSRLWRQVAIETGKEHPEIKLDHQLVDSAAMRLITHPAQFDVVVTENMFGDILTDEAAVLAGSLGLCPSASLGDGTKGVYEPIHGSAPDIAGKGIANPIGTILSAAMLLRHSLGLEMEARAVECACACAIKDGLRTADLAGTLSTDAMGTAIRERLGNDDCSESMLRAF